MAVWTLKERNDLVRANQAITPGNKGLFGGNNPALNSVDHLNVTITSNVLTKIFIIRFQLHPRGKAVCVF